MADWFSSTLDWLRGLSWQEALLASVGLFLVSFCASLAFTAWAVIQIPQDYFLDHHTIPMGERHPVLRVLFRLAKNLAGVLLVLLGIVLSLPGIPGQGLLTVLIGLMLLDFPGKRRLEKKLVRRPRIRSTIDRLRTRFGKPPLLLDEHCE